LALVLKGDAKPEFLSSYEKERRPVAQQLCGVSAGRTAKVLEYLGVEEKPEEKKEDNKGEKKPLGAPPPSFDPRFSDLAFVLLTIQYESSAVIAQKEKEVPIIADENAECTIFNGVRFPHFDVIKNGTTISSLELIKSNFALILSPQINSASWVAVANSISPKIDVLQFGTDFQPVNDAEAKVRFNCAGALVRPDGHVAWKIDEHENPAKLAEVMASLLS